MSYLLLLTLCEAVVGAAQLEDVLRELPGNRCRVASLELISTIEPKVDLLKHFMDAHAVLKGKHLLQGGHLERRDPIAASVSIDSRSSDRSRLTEGTKRFQSAI